MTVKTKGVYHGSSTIVIRNVPKWFGRLKRIGINEVNNYEDM